MQCYNLPMPPYCESAIHVCPDKPTRIVATLWNGRIQWRYVCEYHSRMYEKLPHAAIVLLKDDVDKPEPLR